MPRRSLPLLHTLLRDAADQRPDGVAVRCAAASLAYAELAARAHGLARVLRELGTRRSDRVGVLVTKGLRVPECFYGVLAAGATLVPVDPKSPPAQIARILRATGARHLVTEPSFAPTVRSVLAEAPEVEQVVGLDEPPGDVSCTSWQHVEEEVRGGGDPPDVKVLEADPSYVLHTSGSTGVPKLIRHTHATARSFVDWAAAEYGLTPDDRLSNHSSHHTCFATFDYYCATRAAATTVVLTPAALKMPGSLSAQVERERLTVWYSVPTALVQLLLRGALEERDLSALRWVLFAGEVFPPKHLSRLRELLPGARFSHVYGSTEVNVCTYYHLPEGHLSEGGLPDPLPIGRACANAEAEVVDEDLRTVPDGEEGELLIRGGAVMSGYWRSDSQDDEKNERAFVRRPAAGGFEEVYFRTGDRVRRLPDGNLTFGGRADLQIKVRGHRVELGEVEAALLRLPGVEHAAAFDVPDGEGSSAIHAAVVSKVDGSDLRGELRRLLPVYAVPARIDLVESLPRTPTGKVDRKVLRQAAGQTVNQAANQAANLAGKEPR